MNVVFLGTGPFAIPVLEALHGASMRHPLVAVVTRPDRPQGRGRALAPTPVRRRAEELGLSPSTPPTINAPEPIAALEALEPDLAIVADYGEILRPAFLETPRIGAFNLHASLLPRHRGAAPVAHAILAGDATTGVTLFRIVKGLDSGPIVAEEATEIGEDETAGELEARLAALAAGVVERSLDAFATASFTERPQDDSRATLAPKLRKEMGLIDWSLPPRSVHDRVRAFRPWPIAYTFLERQAGRAPERTAVLRTSLAGAAPADADPGTVVAVTDRDISVACGGGSVRLLELQRQGGPALAAGDYLRGRRLRPGDRFTMPGAGAQSGG